ncbi:MAG: Crp/Fnr family transcriptional regulator [Bryobacteraceae bacterium]
MSTLSHVLKTHLLALPDVSKLSSLRRFTSIFTQDQSADALYFIEEGLVKLTRTNDSGDRIILSISGPGDLIGEEVMSAEASQYQADSEVLTAASLHRIPRDTLQRVLSQNGELASAVIDFLLNRRKMLARKVELLCLHDVEYRILFYLADLATLVGPSQEDEGYQLPITQAELADLIGATRETTSTTLNQLERKGLVKLSRRLLTIPSPALLRSPGSSSNTALKAETA